MEMPSIVFKGTDGNECEAFVVAIQDFAFAKGLDEDHQWMLRFARTRLRGKALRWYATLDPAIKKDWDLFVQALFDQYPLADEPGVVEAEIATPVWSTTTFSPAPSTVALPSNPVADRNATGLETSVLPTRQYNPSSTGQQLGLLRVVAEEEGTSIPQYVWWGYAIEEAVVKTILGYAYAHPKGTTLNRHEALVKLYPIRMYQQQRHIYNPTTPRIKLYIKDLELSSGWDLAGVVILCRISSKGFEETKFSTTEVHVDTSGEIIRFVKPGTSLEQDKPEGNFIHPFVRA
ncbi:hypothetical protein FRC04_001108, partial [Tulasnella sp. 424]